MTTRFVAKQALCLAISMLATATAAQADSGYSPYYSEDAARDSYQFAAPSAPLTAGVPTPTPAPIVVQREMMPPEPALFHMNNEVWAAAGTSFFNYKEAVAPIPDSERGWLPSIAAGIDYMSHNNLYLSLQGSDSFGDAHYNGALYDPTTNIYDIPTQGTTHETIYTADGQVGQGFYLSDNVMLIPYLDVGFRYWNRNLGGDNPEESYHNFDTLGGVKLEIAPTDRVLLMGYASGGTTLGSRMESGGTNYSLADSAMEKVGGKLGFGLTKQVELFTTLDYDHFHYGSSANEIIDVNNVLFSSREPGSATDDTTVRVGLGYHFR